MSGDPMAAKAAPAALEGFYNLDVMKLVGFDAEVQKGGALGTEKRGLLGMTAVLGPDGEPRAVLQMKHGETGESLSSIMNEEDFGIFLGIVIETSQLAAQLKARAAETAGGKPS